MSEAAPQSNGLLSLLALRAMFPQHSIQPVDYDPWKYVPKLSGGEG